ncbi:hypothetical protein [Streptomyces swartbergensis]|uniref:hypothetical protein n=1 Tax=Streptomyces swartbergensis TaxID=487165 RepID=UPI003820688F
MDDSLSFESFLKGARTAAQKAMDDHARGEYDEFALHGGVAFERLAKAVLVSKNPVYLVEMRNGNSDMLMYFGGDLALDGKKIRTVGAMEAIARLRRMGVLPKDEQLDQLIDLRNGTAHTTVGDEAKILLPALAENVEALLKHLDQPTGAFWGRWTSAIGAAVDKERDAIQRDVEIRIKQARHLFDDRYSEIPDALRDRLQEEMFGHQFTMAFMQVGGAFEIQVREQCPACPNTALMVFLNTEDENCPQWTAASLRCPMCHLVLGNRDELRAAGLDVAAADESFTAKVATFLIGKDPQDSLF